MRKFGRRIVAGAAVALALGVAAGAQDAQKLLEDYGTTITVFGQRLPAEERNILGTPATLSVYTREDIVASGARTVQEALQNLPGIFLHDQTGNPVESTVDVRGFPQGTSVAVFLDGVRLNDLQDNGVRWDVIPIEDVERIEVYRGATGPLYGGGALAGVVNIVTRRDPGIPRLDIKGAAGSFGEREARAHAAGTLGPVEFYATAMQHHAQGWRQNDGYRFDDAMARLVWTPDDDQSLSFTYQYAGGEQSDPGSLTAAELAQDPRQSPYNLYDGSRGRHSVASLLYSYAPSASWTLSAQAYGRSSDRDTLTTGRYGSGFLSSGRESLSGLVAEARGKGKAGDWTWEVDAGAEASSGKLDATGYLTDVTGGSKRLSTLTSTGQDMAGAYVQGDLGRGPLHLIVGGRTDRATYDYGDGLAPANDAHRVFQESTWRSGLLVHFGEWSSAYLTYSQGYQIPSVVDLYAYPGYYSNPDLVPTRASDWEAGWRYLEDGWRFKVEAFHMELTDEVVYVMVDPAHFIGQNQNVGRSRRQGVEAEAHVPLPAGFSLFASGSYLDTEVTAGPYAGSRVPMVPRYQAEAGAQWGDPSWNVRLAGQWVGPQLLDNDLANGRPGIPGYSVVSLTARYLYRALTVEASLSNLLDRAYVSRGITNGTTDYFTPAYPQAVRVAVTWSF